MKHKIIIALNNPFLIVDNSRKCLLFVRGIKWNLSFKSEMQNTLQVINKFVLTWRAGYDRQQSLRALQQHQIFQDTRPLGWPYQIYSTQILYSNLNNTTVIDTYLINCKFSSENQIFNPFQFRLLKCLRNLPRHIFALPILIYDSQRGSNDDFYKLV